MLFVLVGIIANPSAGKDIRRIVAQGRFVPNHEKVNILKRVLSGLGASPAKQVVMMPDTGKLSYAAAQNTPEDLKVDFLEMRLSDDENDSTLAGEAMAKLGVSCIITLGGDGTNRAVAKGSGQLPLIPISTGTNNVFPYMIEGTVAGLAAGIISSGKVEVDSITTPSKLVEIMIDGVVRDIALIDVAVSKERFIGSRAVWDIDTLHEIFLTRAESDSIGLSAIGSRIMNVGSNDDYGLHIRLGGEVTRIIAPVAPGLISEVDVHSWSRLPMNEPREITFRPCTIALDGERSLTVNKENTLEVLITDKGPRVVSIKKTLNIATELGMFRNDYS